MRYKKRRSYAWGHNLAYIIGLITADGCLLNDKRHIDFTSKDRQLVELYREIIRPTSAIGTKLSGTRQCYRVQFSDVAFYDFLLEVGLLPCKSTILEALIVPDQFFADFLRGYFDGDGTIFAFYDKRWKSSYMYYTSFASASPIFLQWLGSNISQHIPDITGRKIRTGARAYQLSYAKKDSKKLFNFMYYRPNLPFLERKYSRYLEIFTIDPYP